MKLPRFACPETHASWPLSENATDRDLWDSIGGKSIRIRILPGPASVVVLGFPLGHDLVAIGPASAPFLPCGANPGLRELHRGDAKH